MAKMRGKNLFAGIIPVKGFFVFDIAPTREVEEPFRECKHCLIIHHWPRKAIVLGRWGKEAPEDHEEKRLLAALGGRGMDYVSQEKQEERPGSEAYSGDLVY